MSTKIAESLPETVRIGPFDFALKVTEKMAGEDDWGEYDDSTQSITIRAEQPNPIFALETVVHELMHGIYDRAHLRVGDDEERVISCMASGWVQVFRDNPKLVAWMEKAAGKVP